MVMKTQNPKEIVLIYMHGLNLLPVAEDFEVKLANYLLGSGLPSGAMLIRVTKGPAEMQPLKWGGKISKGLDSFGNVPVTNLQPWQLGAAPSDYCLLLAQSETYSECGDIILAPGILRMQCTAETTSQAEGCEINEVHRQRISFVKWKSKVMSPQIQMILSWGFFLFVF